MAYGNLVNVGRHPVDLHDGRVLGHGEYVMSIDVDDPHNAQAVRDGHLKIVDSAPVHSPRTASGEPNSKPAPAKTGDE